MVRMNLFHQASAGRFCTRLGVVLAAATVIVVSVRGQQPARPGAEAAPVPMDVVVLDREGRPVPGLQAQDFVVTVDGRPRKVLSARLLSSGATAGGVSASARAAAWDIDEAFERTYQGNERHDAGDQASSRTVIVAIDRGGFDSGNGRNARLAVEGLLDRLNPDDSVGLTVFPPPGPSARPTRDRSRLRAALQQVTGAAERLPNTEVVLSVSEALDWMSGDATSRQRVMSSACVAGLSGTSTCEQDVNSAAGEMMHRAQRRTLVSLQGLSNAIRVAGAYGSPSAIVFVSTGFYGTARASQLGVDDEVKAVAREAAAARAAIYPVYLEPGFLDTDSLERTGMRGFTAGDGELGLEGLRHLAALSGGSVTRVPAVTEETFRRAALDLSACYLLGLEAAPEDGDGRRHRIRVRVERPGVTVRAREEFYVAPTRKPTGDEAVREALKAPQLERALPLRLSTQVLREPGTARIRLLVSALAGRGVTAPAAVRVGYLVRGAGAAATAAATEVQTRTLPVVGSGADAALAFLETVQLTPGRYLLRLAMADGTDRVGSVEQVVDATLGGDGEVGLSDLLLTDPARGLNDAFAPVADGLITGDAVEAFVELYPGSGRAVGMVAFDISDTPGGAAIVKGTVAPEKKEADRWSAGVRFDVRTLPPGTYMLNAQALDGDRLVGRVSRPFRLTRAAGAAGEPRAALAFAATGALVKRFAPEDALRAEALDYFLGRLRDAEGSGTERPSVGMAAQALRAGRYDGALSALVNEAPDVLGVAFLRGLALFGQGSLERAATEFRAALRASNDFLPAAFYLGACYAAGGRDREAAGAWQTSLVSEGDSRIVYEVLADAWLRLKDGTRADAIIAEAQARWPGDDRFAPRAAAAKVLLNHRNAALAALEPYLEKHPGEAQALFLAIRLLYEAYDAGKPIKDAVQDRALAQKYAALYREAGGGEQPLVARWVTAMK